MSEQAEALTDTATRSPHIIVVGNEKAGRANHHRHACDGGFAE